MQRFITTGQFDPTHPQYSGRAVAGILRRRRTRLRVQYLHSEKRKKKDNLAVRRRASLALKSLNPILSSILRTLGLARCACGLVIFATLWALVPVIARASAEPRLLAARVRFLTSLLASRRAYALYRASYLYDARPAPFHPMELHHSRLFSGRCGLISCLRRYYIVVTKSDTNTPRTLKFCAKHFHVPLPCIYN